VTESGTNTVSVIATADNKITGTVVVEIYPHGIVTTPDGSSAYVANTGPNTGPGGSRTVSVIDVAGQTASGTIAVGEGPQMLAASPDRTRPSARIPVGATPWSTAFAGSSAYVTNANDDSVSVIDTASRLVTATIALGTGNHIPTAIAASPLGSIWVACNTSSSVVVIDPTSNTVAHSTDLGLGNGPTGIAFAA
jgi:phospholipase C